MQGALQVLCGFVLPCLAAHQLEVHLRRGVLAANLAALRTRSSSGSGAHNNRDSVAQTRTRRRAHSRAADIGERLPHTLPSTLFPGPPEFLLLALPLLVHLPLVVGWA